MCATTLDERDGEVQVDLSVQREQFYLVVFVACALQRLGPPVGGLLIDRDTDRDVAELQREGRGRRIHNLTVELLVVATAFMDASRHDQWAGSLADRLRHFPSRYIVGRGAAIEGR